MGGDNSFAIRPQPLPRHTTGPVGQQIHSIYKSRLNTFTDDGQYASQNLRSRMYEGKASGEEYIKLSVYSPPDLARPTFKEATTQDFRPTHVGASFGPSWSTHWIKVQLKVPLFLQDKDLLELHWDANNEALIWTEDGEPIQGLTGGGERIEWIIPSSFRDGNFKTIYIEMACNKMFGNAPGGDSIQPPDPNKYFTLDTAEIVAVNEQARQLYIDFWILGDAAREFPENSWEEHKALQIGNQIMNTFEVQRRSQESIIESRKLAKEFLGNVNSAKVYDSSTEPIVYGIGNCHIDTCWLWPWAETKRKIARSWSNQCDLLDRYPEYRFTCSQAQQYKWLEQLYPKLFDRVKTKIKEGRFQVVGGSWVEHDTNLPSGESLVRQFLYGQRYFESRFGQRCRTFWLPDTFGYSSQLPQITRLAGMSRFFTQKLSWNNINIFPHTTFNWVGIDNSQVLCHMAPAETYTAEAHFGDVSRSLSQNKSMDQDPRGLLLFGKGDGGGGPTWEHLEKLRRCRGMSDKTGLLPRVHLGDSVEDFYDKLEKAVADGTEFVTWYGELYLELHRGTYTSQAKTKRNNRQSEVLMHDLEYLATMATIKSHSYHYPKKEIDNMWEGILLCQFHDCLPGSALEICYRDSDKLYEQVFQAGERLVKDALNALGFGETRGDCQRLVMINTLPWPRAEIVKAPGALEQNDPYCLATGDLTVLQLERLDTNKAESIASIERIEQGVYQLSNAQYTIRVEDGRITSLVDRIENREIIPNGRRANQLVIFDDKPLYWQAWDIEVFHLDTRQELQASHGVIIESGPQRVSLMTETKISERSWVKTTISLAAAIEGQPSYVEMESEVEWREDMKALKVEFPVDIVNTEASYETQYGIIKRPTHYNTSWDMAKFEVCCHKWADLSENGYGVSILNDSKYGFATAGSMMRLSLLRAPKAPDGHADMGKLFPVSWAIYILAFVQDTNFAFLGRHRIRYAILPHIGPLDHRTIRSARNFNHLMQTAILPAARLSAISGLLSSILLEGSSAMVLDHIKRGEDDVDVSRGELPQREGRSIIIRIYESLGGRAKGTVKLGSVLGVKKVYKTNILEDDEESLELEKGGFDIVLKPFEVATFRLQL